MKRLLFLSAVGASFFGFAFFVSASSPFDITFPIPELGSCQDQAGCKAFCDNFANKDACIAFAQKHGLASDEQVERVRELPAIGPGGCQSESECRVYCDDSNNVEECLAFAEEHDLIEEEELDKIREFIKDGPGGCKGAKECRAFCEDPSHQDECFAFAEKNGLIPPQELERARALSKQGGPGGCKSEGECRAYCQDPNHTEECLDSAVKLGMLSEEQAVRIKKAAVLGGPGGCKGEECRTYCEDPAHQTECIAFAEENGFMSPEDAARARKFAGKTGPGGCRGEQCRTFCGSPGNEQACLEFAEREGLIPPEEVARARKFLIVSEKGGPGGCKGIACRDYCEDPAHQDECFAFAKGNGLLRAEDEQNFEAGKKLQKVVQESGGPGGCKSDQECQAYCSDPSHGEECIAFGATHGGIPEEQVRKMLKEFTEGKHSGPGGFRPPEDFRRFEEESQKRFEEFRQLEHQFRGKEFGEQGEFGSQQQAAAGPGGCASPAECIKYCTEHRDECFSFGPPGQPGATPPEGGIPPGREFGPPKGEFVPRLQENLIREFKPGEIQQLQQFRGEEQRKEFFKQKFEEFKPPEGFKSPEGTPSSTEGRQQPPQSERGAACAGEGGVWDGTTCRAPAPSKEFFPESGFPQGDQFQQVQQQVQQQTERQVQQQILEQQIQQQMQQVQQLQLQQQQQQLPSSGGTFTPPPSFTPPPPAPAGGSLIDAVRSFLRLKP